MDLRKDKGSWRIKWSHLFIIYGALIVVALLALLTGVFETSQPGAIPQLVWLFVGVLIVVALLVLLSRTFRILDAVEQTHAQLEKTAGVLEKIRSLLTQINQSTRLSERAKSIAFRDLDRQSLREAVFDKLQQGDFETTFGVIDEIEHVAGYKDLALNLRMEADRYRTATAQERVNQVIAHIEKLLDDHQWARASMHIERLIRSSPDSDKAKAMRQKLQEKKAERKKILLNAWDDAVKREATDRSLEILRELDMYLTPNEALALQEAARDVFRNKLHNLGVQFSLAVSGRQWRKALVTGRDIINDFPNSKMAAEIRERWSVLEQKVKKPVG